MEEGRVKKKERRKRREDEWYTHTKRWLFSIAPSHQDLQKEKRIDTRDGMCLIVQQSLGAALSYDLTLSYVSFTLHNIP